VRSGKSEVKILYSQGKVKVIFKGIGKSGKTEGKSKGELKSRGKLKPCKDNV